MKARVQHPKIIECKDRKQPYWFFRYWDDQIQPDGSVKSVRKRHIIGPSKGDDAISRSDAKTKRDEFFAKVNAPTAKVAASKGLAKFGEVAKMYITSHLERRNKVSEPSRVKEKHNLENHILPKWKDHRLSEIVPKEVEDWLYGITTANGEPISWWTMHGLRKTMSAVYHKAEDWGLWEEGKRNPLAKVDIGKKVHKRPQRILTVEQTVAVLDRLEDPHRLIIETCIATSTRISEVLGLQVRHVDLARGTIAIDQRVWHQDVAEPKSDGSTRKLAVGDLTKRYQAWIAKLEHKSPDGWMFPQDCDPSRPMWDSGVRQALHKVAAAVGCDFPGLGPHSFRRANITWRQEVGASAIEASKIAGHADLEMTGRYTFVAIERQDETTRAIQKRMDAARAANAEKARQEAAKANAAQQGAPQATQNAPDKTPRQAMRERLVKARAAKKDSEQTGTEAAA